MIIKIKYLITAVIMLCFCQSGLCQRIFIEPEIAIGNFVTRDHGTGKGLLGVQFSYPLQHHWNIGLQVATIGKLITMGNISFLQNSEDLLEINPKEFNNNLFGMKAQYNFRNSFKLSYFFIGGGFGFASHKSRSFSELVGQVNFKNDSFFYNLETGYSFNHFKFGLKYSNMGGIPGFQGFDVDGRAVLIKPLSVELIFLSFSYSFVLNIQKN